MNHDKDSDALWNAIHQIEISVKNSQNDIKKLFLHSVRHEIAIETLNKKVDAHQQENRERFNRIENRLDTVENRLDRVESRLDNIDNRLNNIDNRLDNIDNRFDKVEETLAIIVNHLKP
ncbi:hypothetical protein ACTL6P_00940 [Endozoicomonas acroporae]|uniref:hypothetical protein n=1 Tax=Endozoicomonas acroporae TaxID=1701104 RepID=UPI000C79150A|nr:hypothetical protein [Endozoicomonas acroporae]